jgi:hypothetical protein
MHESALIFVPAATFGQLIPKYDNAPWLLQLARDGETVTVDCLDSAVDLVSNALRTSRARLAIGY